MIVNVDIIRCLRGYQFEAFVSGVTMSCDPKNYTREECVNRCEWWFGRYLPKADLVIAEDDEDEDDDGGDD